MTSVESPTPVVEPCPLPSGARAVRAVGERYRVAARPVSTGRRTVSILQVENIEALVDRATLLRGDDPREPPYWAYLWTGAVELARWIDTEHALAGRRALDLGCGLGLVGVVAALNGAEVTFLDREAEALKFAAANAHRNDVRSVVFRQGDFTRDRIGGRFDVILGAEVLYDRDSFAPLVRFLDHHMAPGGTVLLADARRMGTAAFYADLEASGYGIDRVTVHTREEGLPLRVDLVAARHAGGA